jgi:hypothetical protein
MTVGKERPYKIICPKNEKRVKEKMSNFNHKI